MTADPYTTLGLPPDASFDDVKAAYRRLAALYHPDRNPGFQEAANRRLQEINEAYERIGAARRVAGDAQHAPRDGDADRAAAEAAARARRAAEAKARRDAEAKARRDADAKARRDAKAQRDPEAEPAGGQARGDAEAAKRATTEAALRRVGFLSHAGGAAEVVVVEFLASVLPAGSEIGACMRYSELRANGQYTTSDVSRRFLRSIPMKAADPFGGALTPGRRHLLSPTRVVVCTKRVLLWTDGAFAPSDGIVVEECVTARTIRFRDILGAEARRKGTVNVWVDDGPTLTFRVAPQHAAELAGYVERASSPELTG